MRAEAIEGKEVHGEEDRVGGGVIDWSLLGCHYFQRLRAQKNKTILTAVDGNHIHHRGQW